MSWERHRKRAITPFEGARQSSGCAYFLLAAVATVIVGNVILLLLPLVLLPLVLLPMVLLPLALLPMVLLRLLPVVQWMHVVILLRCLAGRQQQ